MSNFLTLNDAYDKILKEQADAPKEKEIERDDIKMRLSPNLAIEFTDSVNKFTSICAKIVKKRYATSDMMDKLETTYSKIKHLIGASEDSVMK